MYVLLSCIVNSSVLVSFRGRALDCVISSTRLLQCLTRVNTQRNVSKNVSTNKSTNVSTNLYVECNAKQMTQV